jgi:hypothetical protein
MELPSIAEASSKFYRQYSITSSNDANAIENGRCPAYAVNWPLSENQLHWPQGHDYYIGNGENINDNRELREILSKKLANSTHTNDKILFCDLDGVLADFEQGVFELFKKQTSEIPPPLLWSKINKSTTFFANLPWTKRGKELWEQIRDYDPIILTGVPPGNKTAAEQKRAWVQRELGTDVHIITCLSKEKPKYCLMNSILIDDLDKNENEWKVKGGKFLLYKEEKLEEIIEQITQYMVRRRGSSLEFFI